MNKIIVDPRAFDFGNGYLEKLIAVADRAVKGSVAYGFGAADAAFCYEFGGKNPAHGKLSARLAGDIIATAKAAIAGGNEPAIARDQYLKAGPGTESLLLPLDWCAEFLSAELTTDITAFTRQTGQNLITPSAATWEIPGWNGKKHPWKGWGTNDPGNNYHFSFFLTETLLAAVDPEGPWLDHLKTIMIPRIENFYLSRTGGGSGEGTQYGESVERLYRVSRMLKDTFGIEVRGVPKHATETIPYMVHASKPGLKKLANIGDQPREHDNKIDDPDEVVVLEAMAISDSESAKSLGRWWLDNNGEPFDRPDLYRSACLDRRGERRAPTDLVYLAASVGDLFARGSWEDPLTSWINITCGDQKQTHKHRAQGAIAFHSGGKSLVESQSTGSRSGIVQHADYQNVLRFADEKGSKVEQNRTGICPLSHRVEQGYLIVDADASPAYTNIKWTRRVHFRNGQVTVTDRYTLPAGYTAVFQINTPFLPVVAGDVITAGTLRVTVLSTHKGIAVKDWKLLNPAENPYGGYKIEIACDTGALVTDWIDTSVQQTPFPDPDYEDPDMIKDLETQVAALNVTVAQLKEIVSQAETKITQLTNANTALDSIISEQANVIEEKEQAIVRVRDELARKRAAAIELLS